jgi:hypothetical protein
MKMTARKTENYTHTKFPTVSQTTICNNQIKVTLTVIIMQLFSLTAPQHPKKATRKMTTPTMMKSMGADRNSFPKKSRYVA